QRRLRDQLLLQRDELRVQRQRDRRPRRREPARHLEPERVARVGDGGRPVARRHHVHHRRNGHHHADRLLRERRQLRHVQVEFREHRQLQQRQAPPRRRRAATGTGQRLRRTQRRVQRSQHFLAAGRSELLLRVHPGYRADGVSRGPLLSVLGADDAGEANLTYTWVVTAGPPGSTFSANGTNAAKNSTATFSQAGTYTFQVTVADQDGFSTTGQVTVDVQQEAASATVAPG